MLQRWKNSNDYRYLIYTYLQNSHSAEVESFFKYLTSQKVVDFENNMDEKKAMQFMHKKDFLVQAQEKIGRYINAESSHIYDQSSTKSLFNEGSSFELTSSSFFVSANNRNLTYVELSNRVLESKPLLKKIDQISASLKSGLVLKEIIFITNEKQLPVFLRDDAVIHDVFVKNVNVDDFSSKVLGIGKVIFVPSGLKTPLCNE